MKYLFLLLAILFPVVAEAQIELIRPADFRYHVTVDGDTVSTRSLDYKAVQDAYNYKCDYPGARVVVHPSGIEVRGSCPETIVDGAAAPADTVYQNLPPHDNSFLHSVEWTHKVDFDTGEERLNFVIETENVDSLITEVRCGNEWVKERVFPDVEKEYPRPGNTLHYGILWDCDLDLSYQFRAHKGVWSQAITESFPAFFFSTNDVDTMANTKKFTVTVQASQVDAPLTDFPIYLDLGQLSSNHGFWTNAKADGGEYVAGAELATPRSVDAEGITLRFNAGELNIELRSPA